MHTGIPPRPTTSSLAQKSRSDTQYKFGGYWMHSQEMERLNQYAGLAKGLATRQLEGSKNVSSSFKLSVRSPSSGGSAS
jgi:hypothetical protein